MVSNKPIALTNVDTPHMLMNDDFNHSSFMNNVNARPVETVTTNTMTTNIIE